MRGLLLFLLLAAISAGIFALGATRKGDGSRPLLHVAKEVALTVNVARPERGDIIRMVQAPGDVEAVLEVEISSEIVSKITVMPVEEGDYVKRDDLLCRLDDSNLLADLESAEARIAQLQAAVLLAEADLAKAERDFDRQILLSEAHATSDLEVRDYQTVSKKAHANLSMRHHELTQAQAFHKRIQEDLKKTVITAPITGVISRLNAKEGEVVVTGTMNNPGTVIMSISDLSRMQVRARVDEVDIPLVKAEQKGRIYLQADPDVPVPAQVVRVAAKGTKIAGRDVVNFEALLEVLSDDPRIRPGMTANVEIEVARSADAVTIPVESIMHRMRKDLPEHIIEEFDRRQATLDISERVRQGQYIKVLYVKKDNAAEVRLVESGIADTRRVEIKEGVVLDDLIIVGPYRSLDQLKQGRKVSLAEEDRKRLESQEAEGKARLAADQGKQPDDKAKGSQKKPDEAASGEKARTASTTP